MLGALLIISLTGAVDIEGAVVDGWTGAPVVGARVVPVRVGTPVRSDHRGRFLLALAGPGQTLMISAPGYVTTRWVDQAPGRTGPFHLPPLGASRGAPPQRLRKGSQAGPVTSDPRPLTSPGPLLLELPEGPLPATVRVGRRFADSCGAAHPVQEVQEIDLEEYVKGSVHAEVGVFRNVQGGAAAAAETFKVFAVAARSYALWFYLGDPQGAYHLDDTACNQRYDDARSADVDAAVEATRGLVMVSEADGVTVDKFEYASSCGRYGTRPEYDDAIIPDDTGGRACAGQWCGHEACAAHEVNPQVPGEGRCLVRGICQWGAVERSQRGDTWQQILAHYQPYLDVVDPGSAADPLAPGVLLGTVLEGWAEGPPLVGVNVRAGEQTAVSDGQGFFRFEEIVPQTLTVEVTVPGFLPWVETVEIHPNGEHWQTIVLIPTENAEPPPITPVDAGTVFLPDVADASLFGDAGASGDANIDEPADPGAAIPPGSGGEVFSGRDSQGCGCGLSPLLRWLPWRLR